MFRSVNSTENVREYGGAQEQPAYSAVTGLPEKIITDGKERWTVNSEGKPIAQDEQGVRNFWKWFGDSKVVDDQGRPLVVYHGTVADFSSFSSGAKSWVTPVKNYASEYAGSEEGSKIMALFARIENPFDYGFRNSRTEVKLSDLVDRARRGVTDSFKNKVISREQGLELFEKLVDVEDTESGAFKPAW